MTTAKWIWRLALSILLGEYDHLLPCYFYGGPMLILWTFDRFTVFLAGCVNE